jgi:hypothetical protein
MDWMRENIVMGKEILEIEIKIEIKIVGKVDVQFNNLFIFIFLYFKIQEIVIKLFELNFLIGNILLTILSNTFSINS